MELWERLQWVLENRADVIGDAAKWARKAGLNRNHVNITIARRGKRMGSDAVTRLAIAARVSVAWLTGEIGQPLDAGLVSTTDDYKKRQMAVNKLATDPLVTRRAIAAAQDLLGEDFRFWKMSRWVRLIERLSLADLRGNEDAFHDLLQAARVSAAEAAQRALSDAPRRAIGDGS